LREIKLLIRENIPCWYELSWRAVEPAIILRVHRDFIKNTGPIPDNQWMVADLKQKLGSTNFIGNFEGNFGFDDAFFRVGEIEEFTNFEVPIPLIRKERGVCRECKGSGKDEFGDCLRCMGEGKEYSFDWKSAYAISASFTAFSMWSRFPEKETSSLLPQLMTVQTITHEGSHGGSLDGEFSIPLCNWLKQLEERTKPESLETVVESMWSAHTQMFNRPKLYPKYHFRAYIHDGGRITLDCPGDACGIYIPPEGTWREGRGREFSCHNVDGPMQQITLLAGLAALHDKARREMKI
jgi:hypothetical protein